MVERGYGAAMTSLMKFFLAMLLIAGAAYGSLIALSILGEPESREVSVPVSPSRFEK
jgi:hypothetical protein